MKVLRYWTNGGLSSEGSGHTPICGVLGTSRGDVRRYLTYGAQVAVGWVICDSIIAQIEKRLANKR